MTLWLNRAGSRGEYEESFLSNNRIYLTWPGLNCDLSKAKTREAVAEVLRRFYPEAEKGRIAQHAGPIYRFAHEMEPGDWVALPSKMKPAIHVAEITGPYVHDPEAEDPYFHHRDVRWIETDIPRSNFKQDLLYSLGAFSTICRITRNDAERRVHAMADRGWRPETGVPVSPEREEEPDEGEEEPPVDLEVLARDGIASAIGRNFRGHSMALLVEALLVAQGYTTYRSPPGPDKGVDILAAPGPLGFGRCPDLRAG